MLGGEAHFLDPPTRSAREPCRFGERRIEQRAVPALEGSRRREQVGNPVARHLVRSRAAVVILLRRPAASECGHRSRQRLDDSTFVVGLAQSSTLGSDMISRCNNVDPERQRPTAGRSARRRRLLRPCQGVEARRCPRRSRGATPRCVDALAGSRRLPRNAELRYSNSFTVARANRGDRGSDGAGSAVAVTAIVRPTVPASGGSTLRAGEATLSRIIVAHAIANLVLVQPGTQQALRLSTTRSTWGARRRAATTPTPGRLGARVDPRLLGPEILERALERVLPFFSPELE